MTRADGRATSGNIPVRYLSIKTVWGWKARSRHSTNHTRYPLSYGTWYQVPGTENARYGSTRYEILTWYSTWYQVPEEVAGNEKFSI